MTFIAIKATDLLCKYFGQSEAMIPQVFSTARAVTPCALFFDDFDTLAYRRYIDEWTDAMMMKMMMMMMMMMMMILLLLLVHIVGD